MNGLIPIARPVIEDEEGEAVLQVLQSRHLAHGAKVKEFESLFSRFVGTKYAVATNSGTSAIHTALHALGTKPGDEVILPAVTFFSCAAMVAACGATPVVVDVSEEDYNLDPERASEAITPATKAIMVVHMYGQTADMGAVLDLAEDHELPVVEDACQSHGARYGSSVAGSMGTVGCFSFYPTKVITTGEGGLVATDDEDIDAHSRMFRNHGASAKYHHRFVGFNYRMTDIGAALGIEQIKKIDRFIAARRRNADYLTKALRDLRGLRTPRVMPRRDHVFYQYILRLEEDFPLTRDEVVEKLRASGVESRASYPLPIHRQEAFHRLGRAMECLVAERILPQLLEVPVHPSLSVSDLETIAGSLQALV